MFRHVMSAPATRRRWFSILVWARVLLVCLLAQSAMGCTDWGVVLCEPADVGMQDDSASSLDDECDVTCGHCYGSCMHSTTAPQRDDSITLIGAAAPDGRQPPWQLGSAQYPLLRPPALHV